MSYFIETEYNIFLGRNYDSKKYILKLKDCKIITNPAPFFGIEPTETHFEFNIMIDIYDINNQLIESNNMMLEYHKNKDLTIKITDTLKTVNHIYLQDNKEDILPRIKEILEEKKKYLKIIC